MPENNDAIENGRDRRDRREPSSRARPRAEKRHQKRQAEDRSRDVRVQRQAVRANHSDDSEVASERGCQCKDRHRGFAQRPAEQLPMARKIDDKENRRENSQKGMKQRVRDVEEIGIAKGGDVGAVQDQGKDKEEQSLPEPAGAGAFRIHVWFRCPESDAWRGLAVIRTFKISGKRSLGH